MKPNDPGSTTPATASPAAGSGRHDQHFPANGDRGHGGRQPYETAANATSPITVASVPDSGTCVKLTLGR
jgi:hypothetical protein